MSLTYTLLCILIHILVLLIPSHHKKNQDAHWDLLIKGRDQKLLLKKLLDIKLFAAISVKLENVSLEEDIKKHFLKVL